MPDARGLPLQGQPAVKSRVSVPDRAREAAPLVSQTGKRKITRKSAKEKGSRWERECADYLKEQGWPHADRRVKRGSNDQGDITGLPGFVVECKNTSTLNIAAAMDESTREAAAAGVSLAVVFMRRKQKPVGRGYAVMTIEQFLLLAGSSILVEAEMIKARSEVSGSRGLLRGTSGGG